MNNFKEDIKNVLDFYEFQKGKHSQANLNLCLKLAENTETKIFINSLSKIMNSYSSNEEFIKDIKYCLEVIK